MQGRQPSASRSTSLAVGTAGQGGVWPATVRSRVTDSGPSWAAPHEQESRGVPAFYSGRAPGQRLPTTWPALRVTHCLGNLPPVRCLLGIRPPVEWPCYLCMEISCWDLPSPPLPGLQLAHRACCCGQLHHGERLAGSSLPPASQILP